jgi:Fe-S-cluster containining protein
VPSPLDKIFSLPDFKPLSDVKINTLIPLTLEMWEGEAEEVFEESTLRRVIMSLSVLFPSEMKTITSREEVACARCGECCRHCSPIYIREKELTPLIEYLAEHHIYAKNNLCALPYDGEGYSLIASPCPFLDSSNCKVYPVRPLVCRTFPYNLFKSPGSGYVVPEFCQIVLLELATVGVERYRQELTYQSHNE